MAAINHPRTVRLAEELQSRLNAMKEPGHQLLILKVKLHNGVPYKALWSEEAEMELDNIVKAP